MPNAALQEVFPAELRSVESRFARHLEHIFEETHSSAYDVAACPAYKLEKTKMHGFTGVEAPLNVRYPLNTPEYWDHICADWMYLSHPIRYIERINRGEVLQAHEQIMDHAHRLRGGEMIRTAPHELAIDLPIRRMDPPRHIDVAHHEFYAQFEYQGWNGKYFYPRFFSGCIEPNFKHASELEPIQWAARRASVAFGFAAAIYARDLPPQFLCHMFESVAPVSCNTAPPELLARRTYTLDARNEALLEAARASFGNKYCPELAVFILENSAALETAHFERASFGRFAASLGRALNNGLVIDRATELLKHLRAADVPAAEALDRTLATVTAIYGGEQKPWWFRENMRLCPHAAGANGETELKIAEKTGFGFDYARRLWSRSGAELRELLPSEEALDLCCFVAQRYGIGNTPRGMNVLHYVAEMMRDTPPGLRTRILPAVRNMLERNKPQSPLIGVLEGKDATFHMPGLDWYHPLSGNGKIETRTGYFLTAIEVRQIAAHAAIPLGERAKILPPVRAELLPQALPLLLRVSDPCVPLLTQGTAGPAMLQNPLLGALRFEALLEREKLYDRDRTTKLYFLMFADKFSDPFTPPPGLLRVIEDVSKLYDCNEEQAVELSRPGEEDVARLINSKVLISRMRVLAELVDAHLLGLVGWDQTMGVMRWITAPLDPKAERALQIEKTWSDAESDRDSPHWRLEHLAREASKIEDDWRHSGWVSKVDRAQHRSIESILAQHRFFEDRDTWRLENFVEDVNAKRARILAGKDPDPQLENYFNEQDRREGSPEQRETRREEDRRRHIRSEVSQAATKQQLERLRACGKVVKFAAFQKELSVSSVIPATSVAPAFSSILQKLVEGKPTGLSKFKIPEYNVGDLARDLHGLLEREVLDRGRIWSDFERAKSTTAFLTRCEKLLATYHVVEQIRQSMGEMAHAIPRNFAMKADLIEALRFKKIEELLGDCEKKGLYIQRAQMEKLLEHEHWPWRYAQVYADVHDATNNLRPRFTNGMRNARADCVNESNKIYCSVSVAARALSLFNPQNPKQTADHALLRSAAGANGDALPEKSRQLAALAENPELMHQMLVQFRQRSFGLLPIGGKVHVLHAVNGDHFDFFSNWLNLHSSAFHLQHANHSLVLPAFPSSGELQLLVGLLGHEGVIDWDHPELQLCISGRLPPKECAVLGAATLLSTLEGVQYNPQSFNTTHDHDTGFRIMAYDKQGARIEFPFGSKEVGRTDILGRRCLSDAERYQMIATVISHGVDGGPFAELAAPFKERFFAILKEHRLSSVLEASWVKTEYNESENAGQRHYDEAIKPCIDAWFASNAKRGTAQRASPDCWKRWMFCLTGCAARSIVSSARCWQLRNTKRSARCSSHSEVDVMCETSQRHTGDGRSQRRFDTTSGGRTAVAERSAGSNQVEQGDEWQQLSAPAPEERRRPAPQPEPAKKAVTPPPAPKAQNPIVAATKKILGAAGFGAATPAQSTPKPAASAPTQPNRPAAPAAPAPSVSFEAQLKALRTVPDKNEKLTKILDIALSHEEHVARTESKDAKKARTSLVLSELHLALRGEALKPMMLEGNMKGMLIEGIRGELAATLGSKRAKDQYPIFLRQ